MIQYVAVSTFGFVAGVWYWFHCALPVLTAYRVTRMGFAIAIAVNVWAVASLLLNPLASLAGGNEFPILSPPLVAAAWIVVLGTLLWPRYSLLVRLFHSS